MMIIPEGILPNKTNINPDWKPGDIVELEVSKTKYIVQPNGSWKRITKRYGTKANRKKGE